MTVLAESCPSCAELREQLALAVPWRPENRLINFLPDPTHAVVIESPFAGETEAELAANARYLDACILDALKRRETPYASHRMLTRSLNDKHPPDRELGILAGRLMARVVRRVAFYMDRGMSQGMEETRRWLHEQRDIEVSLRRIGMLERR